eukprot:754632-Hanusia_phi.AAC.4
MANSGGYLSLLWPSNRARTLQDHAEQRNLPIVRHPSPAAASTAAISMGIFSSARRVRSVK